MTTEKLAGFVQSLSYDALPPEAAAAAKRVTIDSMAAAIAGSATEAGRIWSELYFRDEYGARAACWAPGSRKLEYRSAAACNAALTHILDVDDVHTPSITHLGAVTIPTAFAVGQKLHSSGKAVIAAIAAGYEAGGRVGRAVNPGSYFFWHTTGIVGPFCSAAAAGSLADFDANAMLRAFGSAGTQSAGLWEFKRTGAMSKSLHTANSVLCGIRSAELAAAGFTAADCILEGEKGLIRAIDPGSDPSSIPENYSLDDLELLSNSIKAYPCCRHAHSAIAAALRLRARYQIDPKQIVRIADRTYRAAINTAGDMAPDTPYRAKFSIPFCIAAALVLGEVDMQTFSVKNLSDRRIMDLVPMVSLCWDEGLEAAIREDASRWTHTVEVTMADGRVLTETVSFPPGDARAPLTDEELARKAHSLADPVVGREKTDRLIELVYSMDRYEDIGMLFDKWKE